MTDETFEHISKPLGRVIEKVAKAYMTSAQRRAQRAFVSRENGEIPAIPRLRNKIENRVQTAKKIARTKKRMQAARTEAVK